MKKNSLCVCLFVCLLQGQRSKVKKKRGIGLKVVRGEGLKVKGQKLEVEGQRSKLKGQRSKKRGSIKLTNRNTGSIKLTNQVRGT